MDALLKWVLAHTHNVLTGAAGTISLLATTGVIPPEHMKYWMAAFAVLTYWSKFATPKPETPK